MNDKITTTIIIATSFPVNAVAIYFNELGKRFSEKGYKVIIILDGAVDKLPKDSENLLYKSWPNKRPTKMKDFLFLKNLVINVKPIMCISNFGSTNIMSLISYIYKVPVRLNYIHTLSAQIKEDVKRHPLKKIYLKYRKQFVYKLNTNLLTNSSGTKEDTSKIFKITPSKLIVLPFLLPESTLDYVPHKDRTRSILIVGRLDKSKGHKALFDGFKNVVYDIPDITLCIAGMGKEYDSLKSYSKHIGIDKNVIFLGNVAYQKTPDVFSKNLVHISASKSEAFGLVTIEALREGTPVICTRTSGSLDIVKENYNGEFFELDEEYSLSISLQKIMNNWEKYSLNAKENFEKQYSDTNFSIHITQLEKLII